MNRSSTFFIRKGIDGYFVCNHECRVKAESEVTDDLIGIGFIFVLFDEIRCTGKSNLVNVFLNLIECHSESVIDEF